MGERFPEEPPVADASIARDRLDSDGEFSVSVGGLSRSNRLYSVDPLNISFTLSQP